MEIRRAYASLGMPPSRYLMMFALPLVGAGLAVDFILFLAAPVLFQGVFGALLFVIPVFFFIIAVIYPYTVAEGKRSQMNRNIHFFVTHLGVLATASLPMGEMLRTIAAKKEYGALSEETGKIHALVENWHMSLPEACRFVAKRTPSEIFADFLDRFAYSIESGEDLESFLKNEQAVIMEDFRSMYEGQLYEVENMKSIFNSMMMSVIFLVIFGILTPVITGMDPNLLMVGTLGFVIFLEVVFVYFTKAKAPSDPIWHDIPVETPVRTAVKRTLPISVALSLTVLVLALNFTDFSPPIILALGLTPLAFTGLQVSREEEAVKRRDDNFPAFIRSLGASAAARGGQVTEALRHLQYHDFGPLTDNIRQLYRRLNMRIDDESAWKYFSADCGSNLIDKFTAMFTEGVHAGGKPEAIGSLISDNYIRMIGLRKQRYQTANNFRGLLYGLVAGMSFALFVAVGIVGMLAGIFATQGAVAAESGVMGDMFQFEVDLVLVAFLVMCILVAHSLASSLMVRVADGGNYFRSWVDFVGMYWVGALVSVVSVNVLDGLL